MTESTQTEQTEVTEKAPAKRERTDPRKRPLGVTERRQLEKLIDNDFQALKNQMKVFANDLKRQRKEEIEAEYRGQEAIIAEAQHAWHELRRELRQRVDEFILRYTTQGFRVQSGRYGDQRLVNFADTFELVIAQKETRLNEVGNDVEHQYMKAHNELERQRLAIQRELLLTGLVSDQAEQILKKMPDPRQVLLDAVRASNNPRLAAIEAAVVQEIGERQEERPVHHAHDERPVHIPEVVE